MFKKIKSNVYIAVILASYYLAIFYIPKNFSNIFGNIFTTKISMTLIVTIFIILLTYKKKINNIEDGVNIPIKNKLMLSTLCTMLIILMSYLTIEVGLYFKYSIENYNLIQIVSANKTNIFYLFVVILILPILEQLVFTKIIFGKLFDLYEGGELIFKYIAAASYGGFIYSFVHLSKVGPSTFLYVTMMFVYGFFYLYKKDISLIILSNILFNIFLVIIAW